MVWLLLQYVEDHPPIPNKIGSNGIKVTGSYGIEVGVRMP